jgi:hypothetical protein
MGNKRKSATSQNTVKENTFEKQLDSVSCNEVISTYDPSMQIIEIMSRLKENEILPSINFEENYFSYAHLAHVDTPQNIASTLEKLSSSPDKIIERRVFEKLIVCPQHATLYTITRLCCSSCFSTDITKLYLTEHKLCGCISEKKDFVRLLDGVLRCKFCKNDIHDEEKELRVLARWYKCNSCENKFDNPMIKFHCRQFDHDFDINQAHVLEIPSYRLNVNTKFYAAYTSSLISELHKLLVSHGFTIKDPSLIKGRNAVTYETNVYACDSQGRTLLIDIRCADKNIEEEINSTIVKVLDTVPTKAIFIAIPHLSEAKELSAYAYNISVVTGDRFSDILDAVRQILRTYFSPSHV